MSGLSVVNYYYVQNNFKKLIYTSFKFYEEVLMISRFAMEARFALGADAPPAELGRHRLAWEAARRDVGMQARPALRVPDDRRPVRAARRLGTRTFELVKGRGAR